MSKELAGELQIRFSSGEEGRSWKWLLKVSPHSGRREYLMKWAKAVLVHLLCDEAAEPLVMVCICSLEQAVDTESLCKFANSCIDLWKKNPPKFI